MNKSIIFIVIALFVIVMCGWILLTIIVKKTDGRTELVTIKERYVYNVDRGIIEYEIAQNTFETIVPAPIDSLTFNDNWIIGFGLDVYFVIKLNSHKENRQVFHERGELIKLVGNDLGSTQSILQIPQLQLYK